MEVVALTKKNKILKGEINLPASKSICNRALIINYLTNNQLEIHNISQADDTQLLTRLLSIISTTKSSDITTELDCENAGTVIRFLTALLVNKSGDWILTGSDRMKDRPIGILVESLVQLGAEINYLGKIGFPPLQIKGKSIAGGNIKIDGSVSSQFISALLLIAPKLKNGLHLSLSNKISSRPYIEMTLDLLKYFGINYTFNGNEIHIKEQQFKGRELFVEPDWSAAAYWYEMVAFADEADVLLKNLCPGDTLNPTLKSGLTKYNKSIQGDSILSEIYQSFGVNTEITEQGIRLTKKDKPVSQFEFDFTSHPDLAQSIIVTCAALGIKGTFTGLESLRIKETDRLQALQTQLQKLGFKTEIVQSSSEGMPTEKFEVQSYKPDLIKNSQSIPIAMRIVETFQDHRMAMAFAPLVIIFDDIQIENPAVVSKSYPEYWGDLNKVKIHTSFNH